MESYCGAGLLSVRCWPLRRVAGVPFLVDWGVVLEGAVRPGRAARRVGLGVDPRFQCRGGEFGRSEILELEMKFPLIYRFARIAVFLGLDLNLLFDPTHYWRARVLRRAHPADLTATEKNRHS